MEFTGKDKKRFIKIDNCYSGQITECYGPPNTLLYKWSMEVEVGLEDHWTLDYHLTSRGCDAAKWLIDSGCPMTEGNMEDAIKYGSMEAIQLLEDNGCPYNKERLMTMAKKTRYQALIERVERLR